MSRWRQWILVGALAVTSVPGAVWASETDVLLNKLVEKGILTASDAQDIRQEVRAELAKQAASTHQAPKAVAQENIPPSSLNWKWGGDLRLRNEYRNRTGSDNDANRQRIRFRYGFETKVGDTLTVGARLATGSTTDPVSTNQSFDTSFNHKTIVLDRAFATYAPELSGITSVTLTGGVIENPFWLVGPLVWDDDLNFDGVAAHVEQDVGPATVFNTSGIFLLQSGNTETPTIWSTQGGVILKPFASAGADYLKNLKLTGALAYHDYRNVTNPLSESTVISTLGAKGNTTGVQDFNLLNPTLELASQYADVPVSLFGDWVHNTAAETGNNGFQIGLKLGKAKTPFSLTKGWEAGYSFERIEPDATFGPFTDSDFGGGGTDHLGNVWWVKLAVMKNTSVGVRWLSAEELKGAKNHIDTVQMDWVTKF